MGRVPMSGLWCLRGSTPNAARILRGETGADRGVVGADAL
jgi:hypothetical protein